MSTHLSRTTSRPLAVGARHRAPARVRTSHQAIGRSLTARLSQDRGDVPGWVMITLVTSA